MIVSLLLSVREYRRYLKSYRAVGAIQPQLSGFHSEKVASYPIRIEVIL